MKAVGILLLVGCSFNPKSQGALDPDTPPPPCEELGQTCGNPTTLFDCTAVGAAPQELACPWGCLEAPARCGELSPAGGGAGTADLVGADLQQLDVVTLAPGATIDGDGTITGASGNGFTHALRGPNSSIAVFRFKRLTIEGDLTLIGTKAIVLVADEAIEVRGLIDATGSCGADDNAPRARVGGFAGGATSQAAGLGPGGGGGAASTQGGGGGGNGGLGGRGGNVMNSNAGMTIGAPEIPLLVGGGGGGAGGGGGGFGRGGAGGGAIQLVSNTQIVFVGPGAGITAPGCGGDGDSGGGADGGGGGGAGGTILLEAPEITGVAVLAVNGGGGGSGGEGPGDTGAAGSATRAPAAGQPGGDGAGGDGAAAAKLDGENGEDSTGNDGGGAGGGIGRIRFHTRTGEVAVTGVHSPALDDTPTTATKAVATVD